MSKYIIGSDEVGYGAWAGPLYVCAVCMPKAWKGPKGLNDSKQLSYKQRAELYFKLQGLPCALISISSGYIDQMGAGRALQTGHYTAVVEMLRQFPEADVIIDGRRFLSFGLTCSIRL